MKEVKIGENRLINGDCLQVMDKLIEEGVKVDAIITDPPYQTTACSWDTLIPFNKYIMTTRNRNNKLVPMYKDEWVMREAETTNKTINQCREEFKEQCKEGMWDKLNKLIKSNGAIVLFGSEPFSSALKMSNIKNYKYDWVWHKNTGGGFATAKKQPMKRHELISLFYKKQATYNPIFQEYSESTKKRFKDGEMVNRKKQIINSTNKINGGLSFEGEQGIEINRGKYPESVQFFKSIPNSNGTRLHPTQKPVALIEYLVKTYTNENELVLDFTAGSFTTGVACQNTNRRFIGIELDEKYFEIGVDRMDENKDKTRVDVGFKVLKLIEEEEINER